MVPCKETEVAEGREDARGKCLNFNTGYATIEMPVKDANEGVM